MLVVIEDVDNRDTNDNVDSNEADGPFVEVKGLISNHLYV